VDEAVDQAVELLEIDLRELLSGGYHIYTTLDTAALQRLRDRRRVCKQHIARRAKRRAASVRRSPDG
jgi:membrane peptidoglycan carboxypeptidase